MTMFLHSQANLFEDGSTYSPQDFPVSPSQPQESEKDETMSDISFRRSWILWERFSRPGACLRMFAACFQSNLDKFTPRLSHHWRAKVSRSSRIVFQLQPSTHRTDATDSGSLLIPTPTASPDSRNKTSSRQPGSNHHSGTTLADLMLLTPTASENVQDLDKFKARMEKYPNGTTMPNLATQISALLPTPSTNDVSGGANKVKVENGRYIRDAGTIEHSANLNSIVNSLLPTPTRRSPEDCESERKRNTPAIADAIAALPTPTARDYKGATKERIEQGNPKRALDCEIEMLGQNPGSTLRLEPAFVEWMMGYPTNYTSLEAETTA